MKRQRLGQHFLLSQNIAKFIAESAQITKKDTVLEIGTGRGILVRYLCERAKSVVSIKTNKNLYSSTILKFSQITNLEMIFGDGFTDIGFTVFVSNLPYSESKRAIEWLAQRKFSRAVIMVQKEFAEKLESMSKKEMRAISVIANHAFEIEKIMSVNKNNFEPPPNVDSVVLRLKHYMEIGRASCRERV